MSDKLLWILSPAIFSIIGMVAGYLMHSDYTILGTFGGFIAGWITASFAMANEDSEK